jgi:hypothetical protein
MPLDVDHLFRHAVRRIDDVFLDLDERERPKIKVPELDGRPRQMLGSKRVEIRKIVLLDDFLVNGLVIVLRKALQDDGKAGQREGLLDVADFAGAFESLFDTLGG